MTTKTETNTTKTKTAMRKYQRKTMLFLDPLEVTSFFLCVFQSKTEQTEKKKEPEEKEGDDDEDGDKQNEDEYDDAKILAEKRW